MIYVRRIKSAAWPESDSWHWCSGCSNYPKTDDIEWQWHNATIAELRESLGKEVLPEIVGTGKGGRIVREDLVQAALAGDKIDPTVEVKRRRPTSGEKCNECKAKTKAGECTP